jgi:hypothetical protein
MYTLYVLQGLAPFIGAMCVDNFIRRQGELCNAREHPSHVLKYDPQDPENACYRDGIFYPRCKDLENPEVLKYHNLLKAENDKLR